MIITKHYQLKNQRWVRLFNHMLLLIALLLVTGCSVKTNEGHNTANSDWLNSHTHYLNTLPKGHPDQPSKLFEITPQMRDQVVDKFSGLSLSRASEKLTKWLIGKNPDQHNMLYDIDANLSPIEAFEQRRGNCLSFTILLVSLADELDIDLEFNEVDLPDIWDLDERETGMILYRHVNAVRNTFNQMQVFDLAMDQYDFRFPQRVISRQHAAALLHSNIAMDKLKTKEVDSAFHYMKLALSGYPSDSDLWTNMGVLYKHAEQFDDAQTAFMHALSLDRHSGTAASNLQRLHKTLGNEKQALYYEKLAQRARQRNPYIYYKLATEQLDANQYTQAKKSITRAKRLHNKDPRFYELSSLIEQSKKNYIPALKELEKAYKLTIRANEQERYVGKLKRLVDHIKTENEKSKNRLDPSIFRGNPINGATINRF